MLLLLLVSALSEASAVLLAAALDTFALTRDSFRNEALGPKATETILELQKRSAEIRYSLADSGRI